MLRPKNSVNVFVRDEKSFSAHGDDLRIDQCHLEPSTVVLGLFIRTYQRMGDNIINTNKKSDTNLYNLALGKRPWSIWGVYLL